MRILIAIICLTFIAWQVRQRWLAASATSEALGEEEQRDRADFQTLESDPRSMQIKAYLDARYRVTLEAPTDPAAHRICFAACMNDLGQKVRPWEPAAFLVVYLKGKPGSFQAALNLRTGEISETKLNWVTFSSVVPHWASS